jgi:spore coat protein CotH
MRLLRNSKYFIFLLISCLAFCIADGYAQEPLNVSNLPIIFINTNGQEIPDEERIVVDMGIIYNGEGNLNYVDDPFNNYDGKVSIEIRGSTSQCYPKKSYSFETQDENGNNLNVSLIDLPTENDWVLYAPYSDKSLMRNVITYALSNEFGHYAPRTKFCELVLNNEYEGIYVLIEKIKRDKNRVNISKLKEKDTIGDDLTGGYIIKIDAFTGGCGGWGSAYCDSLNYQYHYPKYDAILPVQKEYIQDFIYQFETVMVGDNYNDTTNGYLNYLATEPFIDFIISNELAKNIDGYRRSTFMYKDKNSIDGKLRLGPVWDFNLGYGNAYFFEGYLTTGWVIISDIYISEYVPFWMKKLFNDSTFANQLKSRWMALRQGPLRHNRIMDKIDSYYNYLSVAQQRNFTRWDIMGQQIWPNYYYGETYEDEVDLLKDWFTDRLIWLDNNMPGNFEGTLINEIMPSNSTTICDEDGDYPDWIELYNCSPNPVDLENYMISDDYDEPDKWIFPQVVIEPHGYLLIFASGKDRLEGPFLHTNFKIKASGEPVILSDATGTIIDQLDAGQIESDISFGRKPDGSNQFNYFYITSPGLSNMSNIILNPIEFSHDGGFYTSPFTLTLASLSPSDSIYYTFDGSVPHPDSAGTFLYSTPLEIIDATVFPNNISMIPTTPNPNGNMPYWMPPNGNLYKATVLRAQAFSNNHACSKTFTNTYLVDNSIFEKFTMPVFSLVTDSLNLFAYDSGIYVPGQFWDSTIIKSGNYFQTGIEWEKEIHLEYFSSNGQTLLDQDAGVRMHGDLSLTAPQKSLNLYARDEYGNDHFTDGLFSDLPYDEYKRFVLRCGFAAHSCAIITDLLIHDLVKELNLDKMAVQPTLGLFNGEYWGIHTMREKQDKFYVEQHHGVNHDSVDILAGWGLVLEGNADAYTELYDFIYNNDLSIAENYDYVESKIDIDPYIDYYITETYFINRDWPGNNFKFWRPQTDDGKWRYFLYDLDATFKDPEYNAFIHATDTNGTGYNPPWSTLIFRKILENETFRQKFISRYEELANTIFSPESVVNKIDEFAEIYMQEIDQHIDRWFCPWSIDEWQETLDHMRWFATERQCIVKEQLEEFFGIDSVNINCDTLNDIGNPTAKEQLFVYPNPSANNAIWLKTLSGAPILEYSIFDITGRKVLARQTQPQEINVQLEIDITDLKAGIYIIGARGFNNISYTKLIVE